MILLQFDPGTMAGMTDEHFMASVEPLLATPLELELFKRFAECSLRDEQLDILAKHGLDSVDALTYYLSLPECPPKDNLDEPIDDALYLRNSFTEGNEGRIVAERLYNNLKKLQEDLA